MNNPMRPRHYLALYLGLTLAYLLASLSLIVWGGNPVGMTIILLCALDGLWNPAAFRSLDGLLPRPVAGRWWLAVVLLFPIYAGAYLGARLAHVGVNRARWHQAIQVNIARLERGLR